MPPPAVSDSTELARQLAGAGYLASDELALVAWLALALERARFVEFVDVRLPDMRFASVAGLSAQGFGADHVGIER